MSLPTYKVPDGYNLDGTPRPWRTCVITGGAAGVDNSIVQIRYADGSTGRAPLQTLRRTRK